MEFYIYIYIILVAFGEIKISEFQFVEDSRVRCLCVFPSLIIYKPRERLFLNERRK